MSYRRYHAAMFEATRAYSTLGTRECLTHIASLLPDPDLPFDPRTVELGVGVIGWSEALTGPDTAALQKANPEYEVTVTRVSRNDRAPFPSSLRCGFRVSAAPRGQGMRSAADPSSGARFALRFCDWRGRPVRLDTQNLAVRGELGRFDPARSDQVGRLVDGWVEWIGRAILSAPSGLDYAKFLTISPASLFYFADSDVGEPWRRRFAEVMTCVAPGTEWADRYEFLASGADGSFTSGLRPLSVEVPAGTTESPGEFRAPVPVRTGDVVDFVPGPTPIPRPGRTWLSVENATLQDGGTITSGANLIAYDPRTYPWLELMQMEARSVFGTKARQDGVLFRQYPEAADDIPEAILLAGNYDWNWYHWMIEYLPRVLDVPAEIPSDVPVIVTDRVLPAGLEALREFTDRPIRVIDVHASQSVGLLHVAPPIGKINDWLLGDWLAGYSLDPEVLYEMRAGWGVDTPRAERGRRVFLRRGTRARTVKNQNSIERLLSRRGFEVVDPSTLTLSQQRELFSSAEIVVGASGAVMTNYLFMRPGSAVIALTSRQLFDYLPPATLAQVSGLSFRYVVGRSRPPRRAKTVMGLVHADFRISTRALKRALDDALGEIEQSSMSERSSAGPVSVPVGGTL